MDTPYQPTGSGKWIWRKPLTRDVVEFGTLPDPRDARIAELEAALRRISELTEATLIPISALVAIGKVVRFYLLPPPEGEMRITHEDPRL